MILLEYNSLRVVLPDRDQAMAYLRRLLYLFSSRKKDSIMYRISKSSKYSCKGINIKISDIEYLECIEETHDDPHQLECGQLEWSQLEWQQLHGVLRHELYKYLLVEDLVALSSTCKKFRSCLMDDDIWSSLLKRDIGIDCPDAIKVYQTLYNTIDPMMPSYLLNFVKKYYKMLKGYDYRYSISHVCYGEYNVRVEFGHLLKIFYIESTFSNHPNWVGYVDGRRRGYVARVRTTVDQLKELFSYLNRTEGLNKDKFLKYIRDQNIKPGPYGVFHDSYMCGSAEYGVTDIFDSEDSD